MDVKVGSVTLNILYVPNVIEHGYLRNMCDKTRKYKFTNKWALNECKLNTEVNDQYKRRMLKWFVHIPKVHENQNCKTNI